MRAGQSNKLGMRLKLHTGEHILSHNPTRKESEVSTDRIKEIEQKIAELKARLPEHSVPVSMLLQLEELEDDLEAARKGENHEK